MKNKKKGKGPNGGFCKVSGMSCMLVTYYLYSNDLW